MKVKRTIVQTVETHSLTVTTEAVPRQPDVREAAGHIDVEFHVGHLGDQVDHLGDQNGALRPEWTPGNALRMLIRRFKRR